MTEATVAQTAMPEHVANFVWATGYEVDSLASGRWGYSVEAVYDYVPDLESPKWRQSVMDGLLAKGHAIEIHPSGNRWLVVSLSMDDDMLCAEVAESLNAALNAACTQAREANA